MSERKVHTRRSILKGSGFIPLAVASSLFIPDTMHENPDISGFENIGTIAHNAGLKPSKFKRALQSKAHFVELDLVPHNQRTIVGHDLRSISKMSARQLEGQEPIKMVDQVLESNKQVFLDLKDELTEPSQLEDVLERLHNVPGSMASSNNHELLRRIRRSGQFRGNVLYSIGDSFQLARFLAEHKGHVFDPHEGVSIRHTLLRRDVPHQILAMQLQVAVWNPLSSRSIHESLSAGANYITSDNFDNFALISGNIQGAMISELQSPAQG